MSINRAPITNLNLILTPDELVVGPRKVTDKHSTIILTTHDFSKLFHGEKCRIMKFGYTTHCLVTGDGMK